MHFRRIRVYCIEKFCETSSIRWNKSDQLEVSNWHTKTPPLRKALQIIQANFHKGLF